MQCFTCILSHLYSCKPYQYTCTTLCHYQTRREQGQLHFLHFRHNNNPGYSAILNFWHAVLPAVYDAKLHQVEEAGYTLFCSRNTVLPSRFIQTSVSLLSVSQNSNYVCFWKPQVPRHWEILSVHLFVPVQDTIRHELHFVHSYVLVPFAYFLLWRCVMLDWSPVCFLGHIFLTNRSVFFRRADSWTCASGSTTTDSHRSAHFTVWIKWTSSSAFRVVRIENVKSVSFIHRSH